MRADGFSAVFRAVGARRRLVLLLFLAATVAALAGLRFIPFENSLDLMLPEGSTAQRMLQGFRDASFSDKVVISLGLREAGSRQELPTAWPHRFGHPSSRAWSPGSPTPR